MYCSMSHLSVSSCNQVIQNTIPIFTYGFTYNETNPKMLGLQVYIRETPSKDWERVYVKMLTVDNSMIVLFPNTQMVIATTVGGLAATGISYVSSMNTITAQRAELDKMWAKVHLLSSALSASGRQFAPRLEDPISKGNRQKRSFIHFCHAPSLHFGQNLCSM